MYIVGKIIDTRGGIKSLRKEDAPSWDLVRVCFLKKKAMVSCIDKNYFYVKLKFGNGDRLTPIFPKVTN